MPHYILVYNVMAYAVNGQIINIPVQELFTGEVLDYNHLMQLERDTFTLCSVSKCNMPAVCQRVLHVALVNKILIDQKESLQPMYKGQFPELDHEKIDTPPYESSDIS